MLKTIDQPHEWPLSLHVVEVPTFAKVYCPHPSVERAYFIDSDILPSCDPRKSESLPPSSIYRRKPETAVLPEALVSVVDLPGDAFNHRVSTPVESVKNASIPNAGKVCHSGVKAGKSDGELSESESERVESCDILTRQATNRMRPKPKLGSYSHSNPLSPSIEHGWNEDGCATDESESKMEAARGLKRNLHAEPRNGVAKVDVDMSSKKARLMKTATEQRTSRRHRSYHLSAPSGSCLYKSLTPFVEFIPNIDDPLLDITFCELEDLCAGQRQDFLSDLNSVFLGRKPRFLRGSGYEHVVKHIGALSPATQFDGYMVNSRAVSNIHMSTLHQWINEKLLDKEMYAQRRAAKEQVEAQRPIPIVDHMNEAYCSWVAKNLTELFVLSTGDVEVCYDIFVGSPVQCHSVANDVFRQVRQYMDFLYTKTAVKLKSKCDKPDISTSTHASAKPAGWNAVVVTKAATDEGLESADFMENFDSKPIEQVFSVVEHDQVVDVPRRPAENTPINAVIQPPNRRRKGNRGLAASSKPVYHPDVADSIEVQMVETCLAEVAKDGIAANPAIAETKTPSDVAEFEPQLIFNVAADQDTIDSASQSSPVAMNQASVVVGDTQFKMPNVSKKHFRQHKKKRSRHEKEHSSKSRCKSGPDKRKASKLANEGDKLELERAVRSQKTAKLAVRKDESANLTKSKFDQPAVEERRTITVTNTNEVPVNAAKLLPGQNDELTSSVLTEPWTQKPDENSLILDFLTSELSVDKQENLASVSCENSKTNLAGASKLLSEPGDINIDSIVALHTSTVTADLKIVAYDAEESLSDYDVELIEDDKSNDSADFKDNVALADARQEQSHSVDESFETARRDELAVLETTETKDLISLQESLCEESEEASLEEVVNSQPSADSSSVAGMRDMFDEDMAYEEPAMQITELVNGDIVADVCPDTAPMVDKISNEPSVVKEVAIENTQSVSSELDDELHVDKSSDELSGVKEARVENSSAASSQIDDELLIAHTVVPELQNLETKLAQDESLAIMGPELLSCFTDNLSACTNQDTAADKVDAELDETVSQPDVPVSDEGFDVKSSRSKRSSDSALDLVPSTVQKKFKLATAISISSSSVLKAEQTSQLQPQVLSVEAEDVIREQGEDVETAVDSEPPYHFYEDSFVSRTCDAYGLWPLPNFAPGFDPTILPKGPNVSPFVSSWPGLDLIVNGNTESLRKVSTLPDVSSFSVNTVNRRSSFLWALMLATQQPPQQPADKDIESSEVVQSGTSLAATIAALKASDKSSLKPVNPLIQAFKQAVEAKKKVALKSKFSNLLKQRSVTGLPGRTPIVFGEVLKSGGALAAIVGAQTQSELESSKLIGGRLKSVVTEAVDSFRSDVRTQFEEILIDDGVSAADEVAFEINNSNTVSDFLHLQGLSDPVLRVYESVESTSQSAFTVPSHSESVAACTTDELVVSDMVQSPTLESEVIVLTSPPSPPKPIPSIWPPLPAMPPPDDIPIPVHETVLTKNQQPVESTTAKLTDTVQSDPQSSAVDTVAAAVASSLDHTASVKSNVSIMKSMLQTMGNVSSSATDLISTLTLVSTKGTVTLTETVTSSQKSATGKHAKTTVAEMLPPPLPPLTLSSFLSSLPVFCESSSTTAWATSSVSNAVVTMSELTTSWQSPSTATLFSVPVEQMVQYPPPAVQQYQAPQPVPPIQLPPLSVPPPNMVPSIHPCVAVPPVPAPVIPPAIQLPPTNVPPPTLMPIMSGMNVPPPGYTGPMLNTGNNNSNSQLQSNVGVSQMAVTSDLSVTTDSIQLGSHSTASQADESKCRPEWQHDVPYGPMDQSLALGGPAAMYSPAGAVRDPRGLNQVSAETVNPRLHMGPPIQMPTSCIQPSNSPVFPHQGQRTGLPEVSFSVHPDLLHEDPCTPFGRTAVHKDATVVPTNIDESGSTASGLKSTHKGAPHEGEHKKLQSVHTSVGSHNVLHGPPVPIMSAGGHSMSSAVVPSERVDPSFKTCSATTNSKLGLLGPAPGIPHGMPDHVSGLRGTFAKEPGVPNEVSWSSVTPTFPRQTGAYASDNTPYGSDDGRNVTGDQKVKLSYSGPHSIKPLMSIGVQGSSSSAMDSITGSGKLQSRDPSEGVKLIDCNSIGSSFLGIRPMAGQGSSLSARQGSERDGPQTVRPHMPFVKDQTCMNEQFTANIARPPQTKQDTASVLATQGKGDVASEPIRHSLARPDMSQQPATTQFSSAQKVSSSQSGTPQQTSGAPQQLRFSWPGNQQTVVVPVDTPRQSTPQQLESVRPNTLQQTATNRFGTPQQAVNSSQPSTLQPTSGTRPGIPQPLRGSLPGTNQQTGVGAGNTPRQFTPQQLESVRPSTQQQTGTSRFGTPQQAVNSSRPGTPQQTSGTRPGTPQQLRGSQPGTNQQTGVGAGNSPRQSTPQQLESVRPSTQQQTGTSRLGTPQQAVNSSRPGTPQQTSGTRPGTPQQLRGSQPGTNQQTGVGAGNTPRQSTPQQSKSVQQNNTPQQPSPSQLGTTPQMVNSSRPGTPQQTSGTRPGTPQQLRGSQPGTNQQTGVTSSRPGTPQQTSGTRPGTPQQLRGSQPGTNQQIGVGVGNTPRQSTPQQSKSVQQNNTPQQPSPSQLGTTPQMVNSSRPGTPQQTSGTRPGTPQQLRGSQPGTNQQTGVTSSRPGTPQQTSGTRPGTPQQLRGSQPGTNQQIGVGVGNTPRQSTPQQSKSVQQNNTPQQPSPSQLGTTPQMVNSSRPGTPQQTSGTRPGTPQQLRGSQPGTNQQTGVTSSRPGTPQQTSGTRPGTPQQLRGSQPGTNQQTGVGAGNTPRQSTPQQSKSVQQNNTPQQPSPSQLGTTPQMVNSSRPGTPQQTSGTRPGAPQHQSSSSPGSVIKSLMDFTFSPSTPQQPGAIRPSTPQQVRASHPIVSQLSGTTPVSTAQQVTSSSTVNLQQSRSVRPEARQLLGTNQFRSPQQMTSSLPGSPQQTSGTCSGTPQQARLILLSGAIRSTTQQQSGMIRQGTPQQLRGSQSEIEKQLGATPVSTHQQPNSSHEGAAQQSGSVQPDISQQQGTNRFGAPQQVNNARPGTPQQASGARPGTPQQQSSSSANPTIKPLMDFTFRPTTPQQPGAARLGTPLQLKGPRPTTSQQSSFTTVGTAQQVAESGTVTSQQLRSVRPETLQQMGTNQLVLPQQVSGLRRGAPQQVSVTRPVPPQQASSSRPAVVSLLGGPIRPTMQQQLAHQESGINSVCTSRPSTTTILTTSERPGNVQCASPLDFNPTQRGVAQPIVSAGLRQPTTSAEDAVLTQPVQQNTSQQSGNIEGLSEKSASGPSRPGQPVVGDISKKSSLVNPIKIKSTAHQPKVVSSIEKSQAAMIMQKSMFDMTFSQSTGDTQKVLKVLDGLSASGSLPTTKAVQTDSGAAMSNTLASPISSAASEVTTLAENVSSSSFSSSIVVTPTSCSGHATPSLSVTPTFSTPQGIPAPQTATLTQPTVCSSPGVSASLGLSEPRAPLVVRSPGVRPGLQGPRGVFTSGGVPGTSKLTDAMSPQGFPMTRSASGNATAPMSVPATQGVQVPRGVTAPQSTNASPRGVPPLLRYPVVGVAAQPQSNITIKLRSASGPAVGVGTESVPVAVTSPVVPTPTRAVLQSVTAPAAGVPAPRNMAAALVNRKPTGGFTVLTPGNNSRVYVFSGSEMAISEQIKQYLLSRKAVVFDPYNIASLCAIDKVECRVLVRRSELNVIHHLPNLLRLKRHLVVTFLVYNNLVDIMTNNVSVIFPRGGLLIMDITLFLTVHPGVLDMVFQFIQMQTELKGVGWRAMVTVDAITKLGQICNEVIASAEDTARLKEICKILEKYRSQGAVEFLPTEIFDGQPKSMHEYLKTCLMLQSTQCGKFRHFLFITDMPRSHPDAKLFQDTGIDILNVSEFVRGFVGKVVQHRVQGTRLSNVYPVKLTPTACFDSVLSKSHDVLNLK